MRTTRILTAMAATAALGFALAGCTSGGGGNGGSGELTWEDSPLNEYWNAGYDPNMSEEEQTAKWEAQSAEMEEITAQCMADEGFEYTPNTANSGMVFASDDIEWEPDKKEWVEKYGYGIINNPYSAMREEQPANPSEPPADPNQKYVESLSASEQQAYYDTLYGDQSTVVTNEDGEEEYEYDWKTAGCSGKAQHEVSGEADEVWSKYSDLSNRMSAIYDDVEKTDDMVALDAKWSTCMSDAGFDYDKQSEAQTSFSDKMEKFYADITEEQWNSGEDPLKGNPEIAELGKSEIKTALADLECRDKLNYSQERFKIQFALEEQFIKDNKAELDEFKAASEQAQKG